MAFVRDAQRIGLGLGTIAASAALLWFGSGLHPLWPLMWFAPLPVLLLAVRATAWEAALGAFSHLVRGHGESLELPARRAARAIRNRDP